MVRYSNYCVFHVRSIFSDRVEEAKSGSKIGCPATFLADRIRDCVVNRERSGPYFF